PTVCTIVSSPLRRGNPTGQRGREQRGLAAIHSHRQACATLGILIALAFSRSTQTTVGATNPPPPRIVLVRKLCLKMPAVTDNHHRSGQAVDVIDDQTASQQTEVADDCTDELVRKITQTGLPTQRATCTTYVPIVGGLLESPLELS